MPTDPADRLFIAQRAHGNAAEYVPTLIVLLLVCATLTDGWWLEALAVAAVVSRYAARLRHADARRPWPPTAPSATSAPWAPTSPASRSGSPRSSPSHDPCRLARPVVGIVGHRYVVPRPHVELDVTGTPRAYADRVAAAGGRPLVLPAGRAVDLLDLVDALVLTGGGDVDPACYGRESAAALDVERSRDDDEVALVARRRGGAAYRCWGCAAACRCSWSPSAEPSSPTSTGTGSPPSAIP